jgi:hypothetical protein
MSEAPVSRRREFLGKVAAGAVALGLSGSLSKAFAATPGSNTDITPSDKWLASVTGKHRQLFDMPNHENGMGLLHVRNYLNTLRDTYTVTNPAATAVVTLYGMSTLMGFIQERSDDQRLCRSARGCGDTGSQWRAARYSGGYLDRRAPAARRSIHSLQQCFQSLDGPARWRQGSGCAQGVRGEHAAGRISRARYGRRDQSGADARLLVHVPLTGLRGKVSLPGLD